MPSPAASTSTGQRVALRSIERTMTMSESHWFMIAHVVRVHGGTDELAQWLPTALLKTFNRHPRMRLKLLKDEFATAQVHAPLTSVDQLTQDGLLHVKEVTEEELSLESSRAFVQQVGHTPYDRYAQFPFVLHAWVDKAHDAARLFLFSDHYTADGSSGNTVLHDVLAFASELSRGESLPEQMPEEMELRESIYHGYLNDYPVLSPALRAAAKLTGRLLFSLSPPPAHVITANKLQEKYCHEPPMNPSTTLFAEGTAENLAQVLTKCRAEGTTFTAALSAAVYLSYVVQTDSLENKAFKLTWIMAANMRQRVGSSYPKDAVGSFSHVIDMPMVPVDVPQQTFWDLARAVKTCANKSMANATVLALSLIMTDQHIHREADPTVLENIPITAGAFNDLDISNLGKYEYSKTHTFQSGELSIDSIHYVGRLPLLTALSQIYVTSLDHAGYAMSHHYDEATGKAIFDNTVKIMEACWQIGSTETLPEVAAKLIG